MARVNLFEFTRSISNESVSHPDVNDVKVDVAKALPEQVKEDTDAVDVDEPLSAEVSNTKTSEPGPENGGGDGTARTEDVVKAGASLKVGDVARSLDKDQQGGHELEQLPNQVKPKDGLSSKDISTSVESHEEGTETTELEIIDASGAESTPTPDCLIVDLDAEDIEVSGLTDAADKGISEADAAIAKTNELNKAVASVERYIDLLTRLDNAGRTMSPELRQTISWALEDIDAELFFEERVALESFDPSSKVSLEANGLAQTDGVRRGTIDDGEDPGEVKKGLSAKLKRIIEAAVRMFWRAMNAVQDAYNAVMTNMPKLREQLSELRSQVKILDGSTPFQMKGAQRLMIGDEFVGDSRNALQQVQRTAAELMVAWPNQLGKLVKEWVSGRDRKDKDADLDNANKMATDLDNVMRRAFRGMAELSENDKDKTPAGFLNASRLHWSGPLPGNRALYASVNKVKGDTYSELTDLVTLSFSAIPGEDTYSSEVATETLTAGEAIAIIRELEKITHFIDDAKKGMSEIKNVFDEAFGGKAERFFDKVFDEYHREDYYAGGTLALSVAKVTAESQNEFLGYLTSMIKAYMGYISASIKAESGTGEVIEGELAA